MDSTTLAPRMATSTPCAPSAPSGRSLDGLAGPDGLAGGKGGAVFEVIDAHVPEVGHVRSLYDLCGSKSG